MDRPLPPSVRASAEPVAGPAERDALEIIRRAEKDELAADALRARIQVDGLPTVVSDEAIRPYLAAGERVVEVREAVVAERVCPDGTTDTRTARLYVTTDRLLLLNHELVEVPLAAIDELSLAGERVLVSLRDGIGLRLDAGSPRLLRVQLAAARASVG